MARDVQRIFERGIFGALAAVLTVAPVQAAPSAQLPIHPSPMPTPTATPQPVADTLSEISRVVDAVGETIVATSQNVDQTGWLVVAATLLPLATVLALILFVRTISKLTGNGKGVTVIQPASPAAPAPSVMVNPSGGLPASLTQASLPIQKETLILLTGIGAMMLIALVLVLGHER